MGKITIHNDTKLSDEMVVQHVLEVIKMGKISNNETQYCYATTFKDDVTVFASRTKVGTGVFYVSSSRTS